MCQTSQGLLTPEGRRVLGALSYLVFNPALIFVKLASTLTPGRLLHWWPLVLNTAISTAVGLILGYAGVRLVRPPQPLKPHTVVAIALGNLGNLPLVIVSSLASSSAELLHGIPADRAEDLAVSYVVVGLLVPVIAHATIGFSMLRKHDSDLSCGHDTPARADDHSAAAAPPPAAAGGEQSTAAADAAKVPDKSRGGDGGGDDGVVVMMLEKEEEERRRQKRPLLEEHRRQLAGGSGCGAVINNNNNNSSSSCCCDALRPNGSWGSGLAAGAAAAGGAATAPQATAPAEGEEEPYGISRHSQQQQPQSYTTGLRLRRSSSDQLVMEPSSAPPVESPSSSSFVRLLQGCTADCLRPEDTDPLLRRRSPPPLQHPTLQAPDSPDDPPMAVFGDSSGRVGCVRPLQQALFNGGGTAAPLLALLTDCLSMLGECTIPSILLLLGATLANGPGAGRVPFRVIGLVNITRLTLLPLLGLGVVMGAYAVRLFEAPDPIYLLVLLIQNTAPTAIMVHTMASVHGNRAEEVSAILFWGYISGIAVIPLWLTLFLYVVKLQYSPVINPSVHSMPFCRVPLSRGLFDHDTALPMTVQQQRSLWVVG
ncbi:hypothetical protein VOLCADRAFT_104342 [Volvox carteri f. nagariensis]|uniref:Auxin efflux carrier n=1 Tax=Volvox carteri f. nagariensis TaxID=3068 RepID=D8TT21_VOLCA|nr:uncharacterized protein VOLCADRAFT_104342 [Volvox carteri f. nagariensis]EFJ49477.1 hypothetical protein VOLCADRAFT_104342 [Volvox carteri f. nagariensis]|eukprot:XP_002949458.1 hypothetical protein VOLCADRAFT_104342 [Volvox carteri f. nagariensis]